MGDFVLGILGPVMQLGEWTWTPVKRGMSYIVHYKTNLHSLGLQVQQLEVMQNAHTESVDAAEMSGDRIRPEVQAWRIEADNAMTHVRQLNGEAEVGEKCSVGWCPDLKRRYNLGKRAWNLTATVNKLVEKAGFESVAVLGVRRAPEVQNLIFTEGFQQFEATRNAMDQVLEALKKEEITIIGVYGMGGIGKTTLVKQVGAQVCRDGLFDSMIMVVFSQNPVVMQIQEQLANMLTLELHETTEILRAARLRERMLRGKKILVILDDIWQTIDLSSIGIPSSEELARCDSKVILTTRIFGVCHAMRSQAKIRLDQLSADDSWTLFMTNAGKSFESTNLCKVAKQVANECGGLPVALITVAKALGDKDLLEEWQEAVRRLKISQPASFDDDERVLKCIRLSYDYLKGEDAKSCFLLCCLFPEDYDIPIKDLIKYGLGKGLFRDDAATLEEARSRARSVINYLKSSNLLMEGRDPTNYVRMHDVIRDMALQIAASEYGDGFLVKAGTELKVWPGNAYEGHSAISLMNNDIQKLPQELVCPKLQILLLQNNPNIKEIPETFFESFVELKVLDLSYIGVSTLPHSLSVLTNLQALYLDQHHPIRNVSQVGELKKLEILSLGGSCLEELPKEIGNLAKLRILDISRNNFMKRIPSNLISRLSRLEELYMRYSFKEWGSKVEEEGEETNVGFDELVGLQHLNILEVDIIDAECLPANVNFVRNWEKFHIRFGGKYYVRISEEEYSRWLELERTTNSLPSWFNIAVTQRAQKIRYTQCEDLNNILLEYDRGILFGLESLEIGVCDQVVSLMDTTTGVLTANKPLFENLEVLRLSDLDNLKELCVDELPQGSLGNLKRLKVVDCSNLLNPLLPSNLLQRLQNLETLEISSVKSAEYVFRSEDFGQEPIQLRKLRHLRLSGLPQLENIWIGPVHSAIFRNLQKLRVGGCNKLKYIFTSEISQSLLQLEELSVRFCNFVEMIIGPPGEGTVVNNIILPQLNHLRLANLPHITSFYTENNRIECPSLKVLSVMRCPQFPTSTCDFHSRNPVTIRTSLHSDDW